MLKKIDFGIVWISNWLLVISGVAVCLLIFAGAVCRYVFKTDFYGSEELILAAAFWLYFFGSAMAARKDEQIKAEMLGMFIKNQKALRFIKLITCFINTAMCALATVWAWQYFMWIVNMKMVSNVFKFPTAIPVFPVFISFFMWLCYCIRDLIKNLIGLKGGENIVSGEEV